MSAFSDVIDVIFSDPNLGVAAIYTPPGGGTAVPCQIINLLGGDEELAGKPRKTPVIVDVRFSELVAPAGAGIFTVTETGRELVIVGKPTRTDPDQLVWTCATG